MIRNRKKLELLSEVLSIAGVFQYSTNVSRKPIPCFFCSHPTVRILSYLKIKKQNIKSKNGGHGHQKTSIEVVREIASCEACRGALNGGTDNEY